MHLPKLAWAGITVIVLGSFTQAAESNDDVLDFIENHCVKCHGPDKQKADLRLDTIGFDFQDEDIAWQWQDAVDMVALGEMPPEEEARPTSTEIETFSAWIESQLTSTYAKPPEDASPNLRRMNRHEYRYTIRDLLGLNIESFNPASSFPEDERYHGFDNIGERLVFSNYLLEQYLSSAAESIDKVADIEPEHRPFAVAFHANDFKVAYGNPGEQNDHVEDHHFHHRPFDYYMVNVDGKYVDFGHGDRQLQRLYNPQFKGVPADGYYDITVKAEAVGRINPYDPEILGVDPSEPIQMRLIANDPKVGGTGYGYNVSNRILANFNLKDNEAKEYKVRVWLDKGYDISVRYPNGPLKFLKYGKVVMLRYHPETVVSNYKDEFSLEAPEGEVPERWFSDVYQGPRMRVHYVKIESAPVSQWPPENYQTLFQTDTLKVDPDKAHEIIDRFALKAFRRPLQSGETRRYHDFFDQLLAESGDADHAVKGALKAILSSPDFLYISSNSQPEAVSTHDRASAEQYALASRLSYFLWSSMPDQELLDLARKGILHQPKVIRAQAKRMIADPKSNAFARHFTDTWLELHKLGGAPPDNMKFKIYEVLNLEPQMRMETHLFFKHILDGNRDVSEFIDSEYTFLNEDLAKLYQIEGIEGKEFRRFTLPENSIRGGLMGQASIHTATANGIETSPIIRGVWVLENILGMPPNPPPPNVEPIEPDTRGASTIRERLIKHQNVESCASCHSKIDPLGFALEAFNPIGEFRDSYKDHDGKILNAIDTRVTLHSGESVADLREMRAVLRESRKDQFLFGLSKKALTYALGRELLLSDRPSLDRIVDANTDAGYGFQDLILEIVSSDSFRGKSAAGPTTVATH